MMTETTTGTALAALLDELTGDPREETDSE